MSSAGQPLNFDATDPAALSGTVNVVFQADTPTAPPTNVPRNISAYVPVATATAPGGVPTPPNDKTQLLCGDMAYRKLVAGSNVTITENSTQIAIAASGGGGGSNDDISYYLSPATITPPSLSGWTWALQVHGVVGSNANGAATINTYSTGSTAEFLGNSLTSPDYDIIACFAMNPSLIAGQTTVFGIALWDSASGKAVTLEINMVEGSAPQLAVAHFNSFSSFNANAYGINAYFGVGQPIWLRINCNSVGSPASPKYTFYVSVDGRVLGSVLPGIDHGLHD